MVKKSRPVKTPVLASDARADWRTTEGASLSKSKRHVLVDELSDLTLDASVVRDVKKQGKRNYDTMRLEAMCIYVTDVRGMTIPELARDPRFKGKVHVDTLQKWSEQDGWKDKRREALVRVKALLEVQLVDRLRDNIVWELRDLTGLRDQARHHSAHTPPDTWEGVAKVWLSINKRIAEIAEMMRDGVVDESGRSVSDAGQKTVVVHDFDPAQLREAAAVILQKQRSARHARNTRTIKVQGRLAGGES